ncbi:zeta toxin family protein [Kitasatospora sp. NBC_01302]|uniref:zeta toxin family protein n=1 Tax=Kitasatospora sp. NBC_01302 TaxID=2903575 RepID=UPI002E0DB4E2|nr:zeta toxin family protein [Kitasatospora sp. NBC_01302]
MNDAPSSALSDTESRRALTQAILPAWTRHATTQVRPVVVIVAGPPGAGKTEIADLVQAVLARRGGAVRISADLYKREHRDYADLLAADVRTAGVMVRADTRRWQAEVEEHVREQHFDAVVESALADPLAFRADARAYRRSGHRIEVVALATAHAWSQLGVLDRSVEQALATGTVRFVSWENLDGCAAALPQTLATIEAEHLADRVTVVRRGGEVLYSNELIDGVWLRAPGAAHAVTAEHGRPWSAVETQAFRATTARAEVRLHTGAVPQHLRLAVQADAERAAALAEPVRRIAQPRREPPGVDYHRLSHEEHDWIWENLILDDLGEITSHARPVTVYVMGQPGAGKTRATQMVLRALRRRRPTWISGDHFKANHPDYARLLREQPRTASSRIRADYKAWQAKAEEYVRARGGDAVIEIAPGSAQEFLADAARWRRSHRVELMVLDVRTTDSRQGTAIRYAQANRGHLPARFTTTAGHDRCADAVLDCVRAAEQEAAVDHITVARRGATAVFRNELDADGHWIGPIGAARTLAAGRLRPYTEQEAVQFLALQRELRAALPQYRAEVDAITRQAWPLLPVHLQPRRLGRTTVLALPARRTPLYGPVSSLSLAS